MKLISVDEISSLYKKCNADECYIPKDTIRNTLNTGTLGNSLNQGKMLHGDINFNNEGSTNVFGVEKLYSIY